MSTVLFYLAVGRLHKDQGGNFVEGKHVLIATAAHPSRESSEGDYKNHVEQIMDKGAAKLKPGKRIRLTADDNNYDLHVLAEEMRDTLVVYFAVTDTGFGKDHNIQRLLDDFKDQFRSKHSESDLDSAKKKGSVHKSSQGFLKELLSKYGSSKLKLVQNQVNEVKNIMKDNVDKALQNVEDLDQLEDKSDQFEHQAKQFQKSATDVKKMMRCRNLKMIALIALVIIIILMIIIIPLLTNGSSDSPAAAPPTAAPAIAPTTATG